MTENWTPITESLPVDGSESLPVDGDRVDWITSGGDVIRGGIKGPGGLWFLPHTGQIYAYYKPVAWRYSEVTE